MNVIEGDAAKQAVKDTDSVLSQSHIILTPSAPRLNPGLMKPKAVSPLCCGRRNYTLSSKERSIGVALNVSSRAYKEQVVCSEILPSLVRSRKQMSLEVFQSRCALSTPRKAPSLLQPFWE